MKPIFVKTLFVSSCLISTLYSMDVEETPPTPFPASQDATKPDKKRKIDIADAQDLSLPEQKRPKTDSISGFDICEQIPSDVMALIFYNLSLTDLFNIRLTCRHFKTCSLTPSPWPFADNYCYPIGWILFCQKVKSLRIINNTYDGTTAMRNFNFTHKRPEGLGLWLMTNTSLQELNIQRQEISCEGAKYLAKGLEKHTSLTSLTLWESKIGSYGINYLIKMLKKNPSITTLELGWNLFADFGARRFAEMLDTNSSLATLNISGNKINAEEIKNLARSLGKNSHLTSLDLSDNMIDDEAVKGVAEMLKKNTTLVDLNLNMNYTKSYKPTSIGAKYIAEMLRINSTLKILKFGSDRIDDVGFQDLLAALKYNTTLQSLSLCERGLTYENRDVLRKNSRIRNLF